MMDEISIHTLEFEDIELITEAFQLIGWNKPREQYERYLDEQKAGSREVLIAWLGSYFCGYVTVKWLSHYEAFLSSGIPEIADFNVLPIYRRRGIGTQLMDKAEQLIFKKMPGKPIGIGVGMTADYGSAQRMYSKRGYIPDGLGLMVDGKPVSYGQPVIVNDELCLYLTKTSVSSSC